MSDLEKKLQELKRIELEIDPEGKKLADKEFRDRFAYESCAIEGNPLNLDEVKEVLDDEE